MARDPVPQPGRRARAALDARGSIRGRSVAASSCVWPPSVGELDVAHVEAERLSKANALVEVLLQASLVGVAHQLADELPCLRSPESVLHEDRKHPVGRLDEL